jgi:hypothetical protein
MRLPFTYCCVNDKIRTRPRQKKAAATSRFLTQSTSIVFVQPPLELLEAAIRPAGLECVDRFKSGIKSGTVEGGIRCLSIQLLVSDVRHGVAVVIALSR